MTKANVRQVVQLADDTSDLIGTKPIYIFNVPSQVHVAAANTVHLDLFNAAAAKLVRVLSIKQVPNITTAVVGVVFDWLLGKTKAVGTGGTAITPWKSDSAQEAIPAGVTLRSKPTAGATDDGTLLNYSLSSEETNAAAVQIASQGGLELIPGPLQEMGMLKPRGILLRPGEGLRVVQVTNSAAGNTGWLLAVQVEG